MAMVQREIHARLKVVATVIFNIYDASDDQVRPIVNQKEPSKKLPRAG